MPPEVNVASISNPDRPPCPFFTKTGACRFSDRCSRYLLFKKFDFSS